MDFLWLLPLGLLTGVYGTLIGAGGGFVLMPILILVYGQSPLEMTAISLAVVLLNSTSGTIAYARMRRIDYPLAILYSLAAMPGAALGSYVVRYVPRQEFAIVFGALLLAVSVLLAVKPSSARRRPADEHRAVREFAANGTRSYSLSRGIRLGVPLSLGVGFLASLLGIGGGIIHVPFMVHVLDFPVHLATATSQFVLAFTSLAGSAVHLFDGSLVHAWWRILWLGVGVVIGAQLGAKLSGRLKGDWIIRALALALAIVGVRIILQAVMGS